MNDRAQQWLTRRSFAACDVDLSALLRAKGQTRISVVIPARDEAETIGEIVAGIRDAHVTGSGLVDELIVIDSDSRDATAEIARTAGAVVHSAADIRTDLGWRPGKGEAMWKSLFVITGDLVVFIDADLTSFTPEYIPSLLSPLLLEPEVQLVKAFYDRDLANAREGIAQGGRVNELMARPVITLWWPDLAGIVQPLAGEWSARRELLESLSFPSGYGVELATIIDTYERYGLDALAQVDLGNRAHIHQNLRSLGVLSAEVLAAAAHRKFGSAPVDDLEMAHPVRAQGSDTHGWETRRVNELERPPVQSLTSPAALCTDAKART